MAAAAAAAAAAVVAEEPQAHIVGCLHCGLHGDDSVTTEEIFAWVREFIKRNKASNKHDLRCRPSPTPLSRSLACSPSTLLDSLTALATQRLATEGTQRAISVWLAR